MIQPWFCNVIVTSGAGYFNPVSSIADMTATENNHRCPVRAAGTLRNWRLTLVDALVATATRTFVLRINGADTALTMTISGDGAFDGSDTTHEVTVAAGDELSVSQATTFSPASTEAWCRFDFEATADDTSVYAAGGGGQQFDASTRYRPLLCGESGRNDNSEAANATLASVDGTITDLDIRLSDAPTAGKTRTFVIFKNGVIQDGSGGTPTTTVTIADAATSNTANFSLSVTALDKLSLRCVSTGSPPNSGMQSSVVFVADTPNTLHVTLTEAAALSQTLTQYNSPHGAHCAWATDTRRHAGAVILLVLQHLHAEVSIAPGTGKSWTFTLQKNDVDTALTATISDSATSATFSADDSVLVNDGETFRIKVVPSGTPVGLSLAKVTFAPTSTATILGSAVFGAHTTVTATLAIAMGLDGNVHVDNDPNTLTVYGDLHVTGDAIVDGATSSLGAATGAEGSEPASPASGDLFLPNNGFWIKRYSGSAWVPWGPLFPMVDPALAGLSTWVNQGSATVDTTNGGIHLSTAAVSGDNLRMRVKTAPATPYTITAALLPLQSNANFMSCGLCYRQSSDGKAITLDLANGPAVGPNKWTSATAYSGAYSGTGSMVWYRLTWCRITDDGLNRVCSISADGQHWYQIHTVGRTDFLTANQIGFFVSANSATATMLSAVTLLSWKET